MTSRFVIALLLAFGAARATSAADPVPPKIASGKSYDACMSMVGDDPAGAKGFAEGWASTGGGDGALQCEALAEIALGNAATGADMLEKLAAGSAAPAAARAGVYAQAVQAWEAAGDHARADAAATLALSLTPDDPELLMDRAVASGSMGQPQAAIDDLDRVLKIDPRRASALVLRAAAWRRLGKLDLAKDDVAQALQIDPGNAEAYLERGILRERGDDRTGARADWDHAIKLGPDTTTADLARQNLALLQAGPSRR